MSEVVQQVAVAVVVAVVLFVLGWIGRRLRQAGSEALDHLAGIATLPDVVRGLRDEVTASFQSHDDRITHLERHTGATP